MAMLVSHIATTFAEDAAALVTGFGRVLLHLAMAPIERIANACDVAGVLSERRAALRMWRTSHAIRLSTPRSARRRGGLFRCLTPFRFLSDLT
ncbi:MAG: hypothetical protein HY852_24915 [Bradyrhizobium sp.]|uniref:hypothetical protein n=1 Tax=Bradyrhizobium sp. TaxID=376 RepID=UPI0025C32AD8|nr:hypothetical protein [Bradyrhizobium sp.]MBI5265049.1 hypothetical protein [Bradyrhizobium sp.]